MVLYRAGGKGCGKWVPQVFLLAWCGAFHVWAAYSLLIGFWVSHRGNWSMYCLQVGVSIRKKDLFLPICHLLDWFLFLYFFNFFVIQLQLSPFSHHYCHLSYPPPDLPCSILHLSPTPHCLCPWIFYECSLTWPFLIFPHYPPPFSSLVTVNLFFISMSLAIFCLLVN